MRPLVTKSAYEQGSPQRCMLHLASQSVNATWYLGSYKVYAPRAAFARLQRDFVGTISDRQH
jgi:hypothetical protein